MIRRIFNKLNKERGVVLIVVLILLAVGGLTIAPMLSHMSTGLKAGQTYEKKTDQYYTADAGVENALWQITREQRLPEFPSEQGDQWPYTIEDLNGKSITVTIEYTGKDAEGNDIYKIDSTASDDSGDTAIESYVIVTSIPIFDGALVSKYDITLGKNCSVTGNITCGGTLTTGGGFIHDGDLFEGEEVEFPSQEENEAFAQTYREEAQAGGTYPGDYPIPMGTTMDLGPLYITGNLNILKDCTINLTGTIFVEGSIDVDKGAEITGVGSIVAVGDIYLAKLSDYGSESSIIMSLNGDITFKKEATIGAVIYAPNGTVSFDKDATVTGMIVAQSIQSDKDSTFTYNPDDSSLIKLPGSTFGEMKIRTWETS